MSTPFVETLSPPKLENLHCSSIEAHDDRRDLSEADHVSNVSSSSYNANSSKGLSPILECSDEDAKTASSKTSSHSSGLSGKSTAATLQSAIHQAEASFVPEPSSDTLEAQNRSMDITVHDMNGSVLKKINPFDPYLCSQLLAQLRQPVNAFPGFHDVKEKNLPKFTSNKNVDIEYELLKCL